MKLALISAAYGAVILHSGSERSKQLNAALQVSKGEFAYRVDSDFIVNKGVVEEAVRLCENGADAVAVHNGVTRRTSFRGPRSLGEIWAKNFYYGQTIMRYVRLHPRRTFAQSMTVRGAYFRNWKAFVKRPFLALALVAMLCAYVACIAGASLASLTVFSSRGGVDAQ